MERKFKIGDLVEQNQNNDHILRVSGVIHDDERLFVTDDSDRLNGGFEFKIPFSEITCQWSKVD